MATINIRYPSTQATRLSDLVDDVWGGRLLEDPVPTKLEWARTSIEAELKQKFLRAEKEKQTISDIDFGTE